MFSQGFECQMEMERASTFPKRTPLMLLLPRQCPNVFLLVRARAHLGQSENLFSVLCVCDPLLQSKSLFIYLFFFFFASLDFLHETLHIFSLILSADLSVQQNAGLWQSVYKYAVSGKYSVHILIIHLLTMQIVIVKKYHLLAAEGLASDSSLGLNIETV